MMTKICLLVSSVLLSLLLASASFSHAADDVVQLPRHVTHVQSEKDIVEALYSRSTVVLGVFSNVAATSAVPGESALLESFVSSSMNFVQQHHAEIEASSRVKFFVVDSTVVPTPALDSDAAAKPASPRRSGSSSSSVPKVLSAWVGKAFEHYYRNGLHSGIFILRRNEGTESSTAWKEWALSTGLEKKPDNSNKNNNNNNDGDDSLGEKEKTGSGDENSAAVIEEVIGMSPDALPVDVQEVLLAPSSVSGMADRITRRVRCMTGPNVRTLMTVAEMEDFFLNPCSVNGRAVIAWSRAAIWPYTMKVNKLKLEQLDIIHEALATVAQTERPYTSFGWVPDDAPLAKNHSVLAFINGWNSPIVTYVCNEQCRARGNPLSVQLSEEEQEIVLRGDEKALFLKMFPFGIFRAIDGMPKGMVREFIHVAMTEYLSEVFEAASGGQGNVTEIEVGLAELSDFDAISGAGSAVAVREQDVNSWCIQPIEHGDAIVAHILGDAITFDVATSKPMSRHFYRTPKKNTYLLDHKNSELPPQFGAVASEHIFSKMCITPPTRATVVLRANRHYNRTDLPPGVDQHSTLRFQVRVLGKGSRDEAMNRAGRISDAPTDELRHQQRDYSQLTLEEHLKLEEKRKAAEEKRNGNGAGGAKSRRDSEASAPPEETVEAEPTEPAD